jgi:hypothetical protein
MPSIRDESRDRRRDEVNPAPPSVSNLPSAPRRRLKKDKPQHYEVVAVDIEDGGAGYLIIPPVSFQGGNGTGAQGVAVLESGAVKEIVLSNGGSYESAPDVVIGGGSERPAHAKAVVDKPAPKPAGWGEVFVKVLCAMIANPQTNPSMPHDYLSSAETAADQAMALMEEKGVKLEEPK